MSICGIQGQVLEVTVVGCTKLRDTEWISRQDPYVCLEYGSSKFRTRTCTDGGKNPSFQEKFIFTLIEGLREVTVQVWNSNTLTMDDHIGSGRILLQKVLNEGYDGSSWPIQSRNGRYAGEVSLILHYPNLNKHQKNQTMYVPSYAPLAPPQSQGAYPYTQPPPSGYPPISSYVSQTPPVYPPVYPPPPAPVPSYAPAYPSQPAVYPPPPYPPTTYPPAPYPGYPGTYPPY
ncbi:elicitor-responsive protein 3-like [Nymphaea colorata]|nr:elicitor-responsive protein 3-like [Nymphaea colorata]